MPRVQPRRERNGIESCHFGCNLTCPVCFANAKAAGYVYQPTLGDVRKMILNYRAERPTPGHIIQFSGGEPTIYPPFIEVCRLAKDLGISWV